ncbi:MULTISPECIES: NAD(P)/FAD-dependent oxidoreductase [Thalassolituus]|uniref:NAD(P)/FAD-dependent oxidoreductase n=1 Tax=Thalassolituus TaxID=187492 RepID=UPI0026489EF2|nr:MULTISPECIES: NAD(P)/FAD-dependent oxidoreductase [Thalassolituus]|tara:strand:- start:16966 stop:18081 length:1116 start_codon:yes stop_codon:yes gene_type:complete
MPADFDVTIIGGGVIGLACARTLSADRSVLLVEQHGLFGSETSSRNSEVIHAGLYYPPGSLKESLCIAGRKQLYAFCEQHDVPYRRTGKLIVAPSPDHPELNRLEQKAQSLNIPTERLTRQEINEREPHVRAEAALFSPETGILDSHTYMLRLQQEAERQGALLMKRTRYLSGKAENGLWNISLQTSDGEFRVTSERMINAAGLHSHDVAARSGTDTSLLPPLHYCRGHYFSYQGSAPFRHLIYPLPEKDLAGLGIHATLDLGGQVRFGPDTQFINGHSRVYEVSPTLKTKFCRAISSYFPNVDVSQLHPDYAGIRPKLSGPGEPAQDFVIFGDNRPEAAPLLHLLGIESPGLTSSLALADKITARLSTET